MEPSRWELPLASQEVFSTCIIQTNLNSYRPVRPGWAASARRARPLWRGRRGHHAAERGGPLQRTDPLVVEGAQGRIGPRVERDRLLPHRLLACQPLRAVLDLDVDEAGVAQTRAEIDPAHPLGEALVA